MPSSARNKGLDRDGLASWLKTEHRTGDIGGAGDSITEQIIGYLKALIRGRRLADGDELPSEEQLASRMSVARGTIRESFQVLMHMDLLSREGRRTAVAPLAFEKLRRLEAFDRLARHRDVVELIDFKKAVEPEAAALAAERATKSEIEEMTEAFRLMKDPEGDAYNVVTYDTRFHLLIVKATRNQLLLEIMSNTQLLLKQSLLVVAEQRPLIIPQSIEFHEKILEALHARNATEARKHMFEHMTDVENIIKRFFETTKTLPRSKVASE